MMLSINYFISIYINNLINHLIITSPHARQQPVPVRAAALGPAGGQDLPLAAALAHAPRSAPQHQRVLPGSLQDRCGGWID